MKHPIGKKVIILGGGVAGLSAAHELIERGFEVEVYERNPDAGGKARSFDVPGSAVAGSKPLPGEHGFRFFPGFYRHTMNTMERIPAAGTWRSGRQSVRDHLYPVPWLYFDRRRYEPAKLRTSFSGTWEQLFKQLSDQYYIDAGFAEHDITLLSERLWQVATSCEARRRDVYERMTWSEFMLLGQQQDGAPPPGSSPGDSDANRKDRLVQTLLRAFVASKSKDANAKVVGDIAIQLLVRMFGTRYSADYILDQPTSEVWIAPWCRFLEAQGVRFHFQQEAAQLNYINGRIESVTCIAVDAQGNSSKPAREQKITGDYFVAALPVEAMARLLSGTNHDLNDSAHTELLRADSQFLDIITLGLSQEDFDRDHGVYRLSWKDGKFQFNPNIDWMNGLQLYLTEPIPLVTVAEPRAEGVALASDEHLGAATGHVVYLDSNWSLTAISQPKSYKLSERGDGTVKQIVSVIISDWEQPGFFNQKSAKQCTADQICEEVLYEIAYHTLDLPLVERKGRDGSESEAERQAIKASVQPRAQQLRQKLAANTPYYLDPELRPLEQPAARERRWENRAPLFINNTNSWHLQPEAVTKVPNLFLASDYVRTFTQLATMEAANEAARRAVNGILDALRVQQEPKRIFGAWEDPHTWRPFLRSSLRLFGFGTRGRRSANEPCEVWQLSDVWFLAPYRWWDSWAYRHGRPWRGQLAWWVRPLQHGLLWIYQAYLRISGARLGAQK